jgi:HNH endonuclease
MPKGVYRKRVRGTLERFLAFVSPEPNTGCWLWLGARNRKGYGARFSLGRRGEGGDEAHRLAWTLLSGEIPASQYVLHRCNVPCCVNPEHLYLGDHAQNMADMVRLGRQARGSRQGHTKLRETDVVRMRDRVDAGEPQKSVASAFGVSPATVNRIVKGQSWTHV